MPLRIAFRLAVLAVPLTVSPALGAAIAPAHSDVVLCEGHRATIVGTDGRDHLRGTAGPDVIAGLKGRDVIDGGGGDDLICGGRGQDILAGSAGNDVIHGNLGLDHLSGDGGDDEIFSDKGEGTILRAEPGDDTYVSHTEVTTLDYRGAPSAVSVDLATGTAESGWGADTLHFSSLFVALLGSAYDDTLLGSPQQDTLVGEGGQDTIDGRAGDDQLVSSGGSIVGGDGDDHLFGQGTDPLDLDGGPGNDSLSSSNPGHLLGGPGDDEFGIGLQAGDVLDGGDGTDFLWVPGDLGVPDAAVSYDMDSGAMTVDSEMFPATHFENFQYGATNTTADTTYDITGTDAPNSITVYGTGPATIHGLGGDDLLNGDLGDDLIDGGPGADTADGRDGTDTCVSVEHPANCEVLNP
jgi:Ca2+-binding RTX toxin-like protein